MLHLYLKISEVSKDNYRSVSSLSNIFERCIYGHIQTYFDKSLSNNNTFCAPLTQKVLLLINLSQKKKCNGAGAVSNVWDYCDEIKAISKTKGILLGMFQFRCAQYQLPIFYKNFQIFAEKLKFLRKSSHFLLLALHWCWMLKFMISKKFHYVQTSKIVNSKDAIC